MVEFKKTRLYKIVSAFFLFFIASIFITCNTSYATNNFVKRVYTDKTVYSPGTSATISVELTNNSGSAWSGTLYLAIYKNETTMYTANTSVSLTNGQTSTSNFSWTTPTTDYQGYIVKAYTDSTDYQTSAVDVSSNWTRYPRYGYITNFDSSVTQSTINTQIDALTQDYFINSFQFYDWMWRHEVPIKRTNGINIDSSWEDLLGNNVTWSVLQNYMTAIHNKDAKAMAYMMSYLAREGYDSYGVNPAWGIFKDTNHANQFDVTFGGGKYLWMFAPTNTNWQNFIGAAYEDCINAGGFDGIQMDQMGQRDTVYDYNGNSYDLPNSFSSLVNSVKSRLVTNNPAKSAIDFNIVDGTVNGWAEDDISKYANTDFNFSEIWWKANNYNDMRNYIEQVRGNSGKKAMVLAAYMNYGENFGIKYEAENASYNNVDVANNHDGYSGTGFLQNFAQQGDYVQFNINVSESMTYALIFQYGNNSIDATRSVYVDGNHVGDVGCHPQGTWDRFVSDACLDTYLTSGSHTVRISYDAGDNGAINLDCMTTVSTALLYEAEDATYYNVDAANNHTGYSGTGFLQNFAQQGDYVQFNINVNESMTYALVFQYGNNSGEATRTVYVDGNYAGTVGFHPQKTSDNQGTWDKFVFDAYINTYLTSGSHTIRVSYDAGDTGAINLDCMSIALFNEASVRLADATFAASGATHLELGAGLDTVTMLPHEYYPSTARAMTGSLKTAMKEHNKFITAYEKMLFDPSLNYCDQGNQYISITNQNISGDGSAGTIWHISRMNTDYDILHLINLKNESDSQWRNSTFAITTQNNLAVKYYMSNLANVTGVYMASPDLNHGLSQQLTYSTGTDSTGFYVSFTVPSLQYWDMIYIKRTITAPGNNRYEAENAIKTNVSTNTNHTGYTGTGFVDSFAEQGDTVTFQVNVGTAGNHSLVFRYGNDTQNTATKHIYVDGTYAGILSMPDLANWDTWADASINVNLTSGIHTVCICYGPGDNHAINLDSLTVN